MMLKDFVLGSEIAKGGDFHIANMSMVIKDFELVEGTDYLKFGGITLFSKTSICFPKNIDVVMKTYKFTDLSNLVPLKFFKDELENNTNMIKTKFKEVKVDGKQFIEITDEKLSEVFHNPKLVRSVVSANEIPELVNGGYILGYMQVNKNKYLTWY